MTPYFNYSGSYSTCSTNGGYMPMSTIHFDGQSYIVTRPDGSTITCHNAATARWYVRNPYAK